MFVYNKMFGMNSPYHWQNILQAVQTEQNLKLNEDELRREIDEFECTGKI